MAAESPPSAQDWSRIHSADRSWRKQLIGDINDAFVVPRYVRLFYEVFGAARQQDFCEIGSGNGDLSCAVLAANRGQIRRYVTSERFPEGVAWLRQRGLEATQADAQALPFRDGEFDASVVFDVLHHVDAPREMARELMRVARGTILMVESNGLSVFRKLKELTPGYRAAGERSYSPWTYRGFFEGNPGFRVVRFRIFPFLFPFKVPHVLLPALVAFNRAVEHVPLLRWSCSSVAIRVEYCRTGHLPGPAAPPPPPPASPGDAPGGAAARVEGDWRAEPAEWQESYFDAAEVAKRRAQMPGKLRDLGLGAADRAARVIDVCCGGGEALEALYQMGFRDLHGMDISVADRLGRDPRFRVRAGDVRRLDHEAASADWILCLHSLHHLETPENVRRLLEECFRVLKPGGRLGLIDFDNRLLIRLAFWIFRHDALLWTRGMKRFGRIIQSEWRFLSGYLPRWREVERMLVGGAWEIERHRRGLFYFRLVLRKPRG